MFGKERMKMLGQRVKLLLNSSAEILGITNDLENVSWRHDLFS